MSITSLHLALSTFTDNEIRAIKINSDHPKNYHIYYRKDGKFRVMVVPKQYNDEIEKLQKEVNILLNRSTATQMEYGAKDCK